MLRKETIKVDETPKSNMITHIKVENEQSNPLSVIESFHVISESLSSDESRAKPDPNMLNSKGMKRQNSFLIQN